MLSTLLSVTRLHMRLVCLMALISSSGFSQQWTPLNTQSSSDLKALFFIDAQLGWVGGTNGEILNTTDGGQSWTLQNTGTTETIRCMHFINSLTGWAAGNQGVLIKTTDGGESWSAQDSNTTQQINAIKFLNDTDGWLVGNNKVIRETTDGGTSWGTQNLAGPSISLWGLSIVDAQNLWGSATGKTLINTTNGGTNWQSITDLPGGALTTFNDILFTDANNGWVVGYNVNTGSQIFHTTTGAGGWIPQSAGNSNDLLNVEFIDNNTGWICGRNGTILNTINAGTDWGAQASGSTKTFWDIKFINDSTGWAVADSGTVIKYQLISSSIPLTLLQPNGGEIYQIGSVQNIIWNANGVSNIKLEYSTDGTTWTTIAASVPTSPSSYAWTIPNTPSLTATVRISDTGNASIADTSQSTFYIQPVPVGIDYAVLATATSTNSPAQITVNWIADPNALSYTIDRKLKEDSVWTFLSNVVVDINSYTDLNVAVGEAFEYRITKTTPQLTSYGYVYSGLELPETDFRGEILLLVDDNFSSAIEPELTQLAYDLIGDGYRVKTVPVAPSVGVAGIKTIVTEEFSLSNNTLSSVLIIGHLPAPYSGNFAPDGHAERVGAQPADGYYAEMDGTWTDDITVTNTGLIYTPNDPGDGKFDQSTFPSLIELQLGRVDMHDMTGFALSETDLLKQYLNKNHDFKLKVSDPSYRALMNTSLDGIIPTTSGAAWRSFSAMFGSAIKELDNCGTGCSEYLDSLITQSYLWSHMAGGGSDTSMSDDVFTSSQCINNPINTVFMQMYGSYLVEWYKGSITGTVNHLLRAPLASNGTTLATVWSGKAPYWHFHHMALGETIGYSTLVNQNNFSTYDAGSSQLRRGVHMALMGDPSLKMHIVAPVSNVSAIADLTSVNVTWTASTDNIVGYSIYRADDMFGQFEKINSAIVTGTDFTDDDPVQGNNVYMVRAVKLENRPSGSYYNLSTGLVDSVQFIGGTGVNEAAVKLDFLVVPNPFSTETVLWCKSSVRNATLSIYSSDGQLVKQHNNVSGPTISLSRDQLSCGLYFISLTDASNTTVTKTLIIID